jgi:hypothetical protein
MMLATCRQYQILAPRVPACGAMSTRYISSRSPPIVSRSSSRTKSRRRASASLGGVFRILVLSLGGAQAPGDAVRHQAQRFVNPGEGPLTGWLNGVEALALSTPLGCGFAKTGRDEPALLETIERSIEGSRRDRPPGSAFDFPPDRDAVSIASKPNEREENELLEVTD